MIQQDYKRIVKKLINSFNVDIKFNEILKDCFTYF